MRNLKKFLALVLAMMMALSLMVTANAMNPNYDYPDIEDATFTEAIDVLTGMGVFRGDNGEFKPDRPIMRSEAVAVLYRLVTGDVSDSQAELYAPAAAYFTDVAPTAWYAGYVGFAVDAGFVKGFNGEFNPNGYVTGYEMLAMLLRAVGYGKNGEFTGSQWMINVGATAQSLKILRTIESTDFANTLAKASPREVVAELAFQTAARVPTVRYEYGYYNQYQGIAVATGDNALNPTLGKKVFGLTSNDGIVVGNQETGETKTLISPDYDHDSTYRIDVDTKTTLALYGHAVTAWTNGEGHGYAIIDEATAATVYAAKTNLKYQDIATAAGMKAEDNFELSLEYAQFGTVAKGDTVTDESAIKMYSVIDNDANGKADVIIRLNAEVAQVTETNTTKVPQVIKLGGKKASSFTNGTDSYLTVSAPGNQVIGEFDIKTALGKIFTVWQVKGSTVAYTAGAPAFAADDYAVLKTPLETKTGTVTTYTKNGSTVTSVTLAGGETIKCSGILEGGQDVAYVNGTGIDESEINAGVNYTFVVDELGRFLDISSPNEWSFLYGTFADFQYGALGSGSIEYKMYGIDWEGKNVNDKALNWMIVDGTPYGAGADDTLGDGYMLSDFIITKKNMSTNSVVPGSNIGVMMTDKGQMVNVGVNGITDGSGKLEQADPDNLIYWSVTNKDAANGFAKVTNGDGFDYMLTNDTVFYVVTGFGTGATVQTYKGLKELVGSGTSVNISYAADDDNGPTDEVWFKVGDWTFDKLNTGNNNTITTMILSASNLEGFSTQNLYFSSEYNTQATGIKLVGKDAAQWTLWLNGEPNEYFISGGTDLAGNAVVDGQASKGRFFTLSLDEVYNGVPIYKATPVGTAVDSDPKQDLPGNGGVCNVDLSYNYVMVNNYNKAEIEGIIMNVDGAKIADVQYNEDPAFDDSTRIEIDSLLKLNNAVSIYGEDKITVAIVNDGINVATIYVIDVEM